MDAHKPHFFSNRKSDFAIYLQTKTTAHRNFKTEFETNKALILEWLSFIVALHFLLLLASPWSFLCVIIYQDENYKWKVFEWVVRKSLSKRIIFIVAIITASFQPSTFTIHEVEAIIFMLLCWWKNHKNLCAIFSSCLVPNFLYWCARIVYGFVAAFWLCYISFQMWFMSFISLSFKFMSIFLHLKSNFFFVVKLSQL